MALSSLLCLYTLNGKYIYNLFFPRSDRSNFLLKISITILTSLFSMIEKKLLILWVFSFCVPWHWNVSNISKEGFHWSHYMLKTVKKHNNYARHLYKCLWRMSETIWNMMKRQITILSPIKYLSCFFSNDIIVSKIIKISFDALFHSWVHFDSFNL